MPNQHIYFEVLQFIKSCPKTVQTDNKIYSLGSSSPHQDERNSVLRRGLLLKDWISSFCTSQKAFDSSVVPNTFPVHGSHQKLDFSSSFLSNFHISKNLHIQYIPSFQPRFPTSIPSSNPCANLLVRPGQGTN